LSNEERRQHEPVLKSSFEDTMRVMKASRSVLDTPSQVAHAGLLGVSLLFLAAILTMARLDSLLNYAVIAFAAAIPLLVLGYVTASFDFDPVPGALFGRSIVAAGQVVGFVGQIAAGAGVVLVIWHMSGTAVAVLGGVAVAGLLALPLLGVVIAIVEAIRISSKEKAEASEPTTTGEVALPND